MIDEALIKASDIINKQDCMEFLENTLGLGATAATQIANELAAAIAGNVTITANPNACAPKTPTVKNTDGVNAVTEYN